MAMRRIRRLAMRLARSVRNQRLIENTPYGMPVKSAEECEKRHSVATPPHQRQQQAQAETRAVVVSSGHH
ncbi:hypothetical protein SAMN05660652_01207 [Propionivibrio dicarboxylicus]|uniref:Uncharacterized protein n=1 Tax=Propionivibrio dicarboxylicus TaxID=83767 RepID=A0A1G7ZL66_9RHOO|nr:hypothetical protein SAMN05660652_01207 [Propionivibrio dicarboxylicus]